MSGDEFKPIGGTIDDVLDRIAAYHAQYVEEEKPERDWVIKPMPAIAWIMQKSKGTVNPQMVQSYVDGRNAGRLNVITLAATHRQAYDRGWSDAEGERLLREIFGPPKDGTLVLRGGGWTICPFEHGDGFAITPPVVPPPER
jgi:hypothetical protein